MTTFNLTWIENWKSKGYNYLLVLPREKYGVLRPLNEPREVKKGYTIEIDDLRLIHLDKDYFLVKEKDAPRQMKEIKLVQAS